MPIFHFLYFIYYSIYLIPLWKRLSLSATKLPPDMADTNVETNSSLANPETATKRNNGAMNNSIHTSP